MAIDSMDKRVTIKMFVDSLGGKFQQLLASTMKPEEKLAAIIAEMEKAVQEKRVLARQAGAQMRVLKDDDTTALEPLEKAEKDRAALVELGAKYLNNKARLGQISQSIQGLDLVIKSQQATYDMSVQSYEMAKKNYEDALAALENARSQGPAMLTAIRVHEEALRTRDQMRNSTTQIDTKFMNELAADLSSIQAQVRSDEDLEKDLDPKNSFSIDKALSDMDAESVNADLMAEFQAAADKKKK